MKHLPYAYMAREIVANAIGKHILSSARAGVFMTTPVVVVVDEAHNFLSKEIGDEYSRFALDAFESIAREGRKFALTICLATQRPRDLTESVLSQLGALIVHRLTNSADRDVIERSAGEIDRSAASFLPTLAPGKRS
jgi:DNA helicase HerA-like ATPase